MLEVIKISGNSKFTNKSVESKTEALEIAKNNSKESCIAVFENKKEIFRFTNGKIEK